MNIEKFVECELALETDVLEENQPERHFVHHESHTTWLGIKRAPTPWDAGNEPPELWHGQRRVASSS